MAIARSILILTLTIISIHTPLTLNAEAACWSIERKLFASTAAISTAAAIALLARKETNGPIWAFLKSPTTYITSLKARGATKKEIGSFIVAMAVAIATIIITSIMASKAKTPVPSDQPEMMPSKPEKPHQPTKFITPTKTPPTIPIAIPNDLSKYNNRISDEYDEVSMIMQVQHLREEQLRKKSKTPDKETVHAQAQSHGSPVTKNVPSTTPPTAQVEAAPIIATEQAMKKITTELQGLHSVLQATKTEAEGIHFRDPMLPPPEERVSSITRELVENTEALAKQQDMLKQLSEIQVPQTPAPTVAPPAASPVPLATDSIAPRTSSFATPQRTRESKITLTPTQRNALGMLANIQRWHIKMQKAVTEREFRAACSHAYSALTQLKYSHPSLIPEDKEAAIKETEIAKAAELEAIEKDKIKQQRLRTIQIKAQAHYEEMLQQLAFIASQNTLTAILRTRKL